MEVQSFYRWKNQFDNWKKAEIEKDGVKTKIDAPAVIKKARTFVPLRAIAEISGAKSGLERRNSYSDNKKIVKERKWQWIIK